MDTYNQNAMTNTEIIQGIFIAVVAGIILFGVSGGFKRVNRLIDRRKVYKWLYTEIALKNTYTWRTTKAIASATNLTEDRVRLVSSTSKRICQNAGSKDSWGLRKYSKDEPDRIYSSREFN